MQVTERTTGCVLVVDDEPEVRAILRAGLEAEGFRVLEAGNGAEAQSRLSEAAIDLVTLDLRLGGEDGLKLARELRAKRNTPIVMITGKGDPIDRVVGLELGADDYIAKPFLMREVVARIRAVLRRYVQSAEVTADLSEVPAGGARFKFDAWTIDVPRREVRNPKNEICDLTTAEFNLLMILVQRPGRVLSRDEIMDLLKGHDWNPLDRSIDALVARLRKKIEPESECPRLVKTVRGVGYAFAGSVKRL
jgi:DNA-binding response OmpR family regulator